MPTKQLHHTINRRSGSRRLATITTLAAITLFTVLAGKLLPALLNGTTLGSERLLSFALMLNIGLIFFGWWRSKQLSLSRWEASLAAREAREAALVDFITGLPNRRAFVQSLYQEVGRGGELALIMLDLDRFKNVNDLFGHPVGDELLRRVSFILRECAADAFVARLGGDEFGLLVRDLMATRERCEALASSIIDRLSHPLDLGETEAHVGASIGITLREDETIGAEELLKRSDLAMYTAKQRGRNQFVWFDADMQDELRKRTELEAEIRLGIARGEFVPFFQPQISLATRSLQGFEVLARWQHPTRGTVEPSEFIPIAEASGLISDLSSSVMKQALLEAKEWSPNLTIAVNLSAIQLQDPLLPQRISKILLETGFPAGRLELELTESSFFENQELALATIESVKNLGITVSLDDFGTGYASLTQLKALPFDRLKVDRTFVSSMTDSSESAAIVSAIVNLGASLSLPVTAEGVETAAIEKNLRLIGCSDAQGWLFGKATSAVDVRRLLEELGHGQRISQKAEGSLGRPARRRRA